MQTKQVVIANPVINSPFEEPKLHFRFSEQGITDEIGHGSFGREKLLGKFSRTRGAFWANDQQKSLDVALKRRSRG